jgi:hypothetical protein
MLKIARYALALAVAIAPAAGPLEGHHGPTVKFDPNQPITLSGSVTMLDWTNPHAHIYMLVPEGDSLTPW